MDPFTQAMLLNYLLGGVVVIILGLTAIILKLNSSEDKKKEDHKHLRD